jgi:hypothetical protein
VDGNILQNINANTPQECNLHNTNAGASAQSIFRVINDASAGLAVVVDSSTGAQASQCQLIGVGTAGTTLESGGDLGLGANNRLDDIVRYNSSHQ